MGLDRILSRSHRHATATYYLRRSEMSCWTRPDHWNVEDSAERKE